MTEVTVDLDDLKTLLFATSGIKDIEAAIQQRKTNPMVGSAQGKMAAAHDRLSAAWRRAEREQTWPARLVTEADIAALRDMFTDPQTGEPIEVALLSAYPMHLAQGLMLVESGPVFQGVKIEWPSPSDPEFRIQGVQPTQYAARLTHYGRQVLASAGVAPHPTSGEVPARIHGAQYLRLSR